jgi:HD-like signal output (HDOD) protein
VEYARRNEIPLQNAEQRVFGTDHAQVGGLLASKWNLADRVRAAIEFHHDFASADEHRAPCAVVSLADSMAYRCGMGNNLPGEREYEPAALELVGVPEQQLHVIQNVVLEEIGKAEIAFQVQAA